MPSSINISALLLLLSASDAAAERVMVDRVAAVVEDDIVTLRELEERATPFLSELAGVVDPVEREARRMEILRQILDIEIGERVVDKEIQANQDKLGVTEKDVEAAISEVLKMNRMTRDQLQDALYRQGLTWSEYQKKLRQQIERARLIQFKVQGKLQIKDSDARRRCEARQASGTTGEKVCASHLLLKVPEQATPEQVQQVHGRAAKLQAELSSGADFDAYALKYSDDKSAPDGNLGCFARGEMVETFERAAFETKVGGVSAAVRTEFGIHIIKVTDRQYPASPCETEEALMPFRNEIYQEEMERQTDIWIQELRKKAFVEVRI